MSSRMTERSGRPTAFPGIVITLIILLSFALFWAVSSGTQGPPAAWQYAGSQTPAYMAVDSSDTAYAFFGSAVIAIDRYGDPAWNLTFPAGSRACGDRAASDYLPLCNGTTLLDYDIVQTPVYATENGTLYLYVRSDRPSSFLESAYANTLPLVDTGRSIVAVSPGGKRLWSVTLDGPATAFDDTAITASGDRVYVFHQYNETVLDRDGRVLFSIADVSDPAAIGPDGTIYVSKSRPYNASGNPWLAGADLRVPSGTVEACAPDATLRWRTSVNLSLVGTYSGDRSMPVLQGGQLYLPARDGMVALGTNGSVLWSRTFAGMQNLDLFGLMPFDASGDVYLTDMVSSRPFYEIDRSGRDVAQNITGAGVSRVAGAGDGVIYYFMPAAADENRTLYRPDSERIVAQEIAGGAGTWNLTLPVINATPAVVDDQNVDRYFGYSVGGNRTMADLIRQSSQDDRTIDGSARLEDANVTIKTRVVSAGLYPGHDVIYASLSTMAYEDPVRLNVSQCVYSSGLYAIDRNGTLLWCKPLGDLVQSALVRNDTIYYSAGHQIGAARTGVAAGVALLAVACVFLKFFLVGAVSRLKDRMPPNGNRSRVYECIRRCPGLSLHEISRETRVNLGTVRYHLWMLEVGRRIVSRRTDRKYVRYFQNPCAYTREEQLALSVAKRDVMARILRVLSVRPGLTNRELSGATGIREDAMSRYMIELAGLGIVERRQDEGRATYRISAGFTGAVEKSLAGPGPASS